MLLDLRKKNQERITKIVVSKLLGTKRSKSHGSGGWTREASDWGCSLATGDHAREFQLPEDGPRAVLVPQDRTARLPSELVVGF